MDEVGEIYHEDAVIEYPQSGERILGRDNLRGRRESHPAPSTFPFGESSVLESYFADPSDAPDWRSQWVEIGPRE